MLKSLAILVICFIASCTGSTLPLKPRPRLDGRIVGGTVASISNYPYQLSLQYDGRHMCGASIISANWAVTASHCVQGASASRIFLRAGSSSRASGGSVHQVAQIISHPSYNAYTVDYDVAVLRVSIPFSFGPNVQPIPLVSQDQSTPEGTTSVVTGWGTTSEGGFVSDILMQVDVPIVSNARCNSAYGGGITERMLCAGFTAGGKDACQGDSGGPLAANGRLIAIVSWGYGCARPNYPGVFANVAALRSWIASASGV